MHKTSGTHSRSWSPHPLPTGVVLWDPERPSLTDPFTRKDIKPSELVPRVRELIALWRIQDVDALTRGFWPEQIYFARDTSNFTKDDWQIALEALGRVWLDYERTAQAGKPIGMPGYKGSMADAMANILENFKYEWGFLNILAKRVEEKLKNTKH